jgi:hypothetical protein
MSNAKKGAFPSDRPAGRDGGLTKLEHFAGLAMQGIVARQWYDPDGMAADAVVCARALLAELEKGVQA